MDNETGREMLLEQIEDTRRTRPQSALFIGIWAALALYAVGYFVVRIVGWL